MVPRRQRLLLILAVVAAVLLVAWAALAVIGVEPYDNEGFRNALIATLTVVGVVLSAGLARLASRTGRSREQAGERERELAASLAQCEQQADGERRATARAAAALQRERHWSAELRHQVGALQQSGSVFSPWEDVRSLILRVALDLTEAPKGLVLARGKDGGPLEVVAAEGFDEDARRSEIARRFAERALERDEVVREEAPPVTDAPVDAEITTLIAIPLVVSDELHGVVVCADRPGGFDDCDDDMLLALGDNASSVVRNSELHDELQTAFVATVQLLSDAIQAKDPFLRGHSEDVADYVEAISHELDLDDADRENLAFASLLHDVGKIGISERILLKPGRLTPEERSIVELHPRIGYRLVEQVPGMEAIAPVIRHHHERWDGEGYPARLRGEEIPLGARVVGVADAFSAMTEQRPYRDRMSAEDACAELERCAGSQFDPRVVGLFCREARGRPRERRLGPVAAALDDAELSLRRGADGGVLDVGPAALTDPLTLLYSHRYFHEVAAAQAERAQLQGIGFAVVLVRLTGLGALNAAGGYSRGDDTLRSCARALSRVAVLHGAVACRVGGSRLGLMAEGLDAGSAANLATELEATLTPILSVHVAAVSWEPGSDGEAVIARAERTLALAAGAR